MRLARMPRLLLLLLPAVFLAGGWPWSGQALAAGQTEQAKQAVQTEQAEQVQGGVRTFRFPAQVRPGRVMTYRELVVMQILGLPGSGGTVVVRMEAELEVAAGQPDGRGNIPVEITFSRVDVRSNLAVQEDPAQLQGSKLRMKISPDGKILGYKGAAVGLEAANIGSLEAAVVSGGMDSGALGVLERGGLLRVIAWEQPPEPLEVGGNWREEARNTVQTSMGPVELQVDTIHSLMAVEQMDGAEIAQINTVSSGQAGGNFPAGQGRRLQVLVKQNAQGVTAFDMTRGVLLKDVGTVGQTVISQLETDGPSGAAGSLGGFTMQVETHTVLELIALEAAYN